MVGWIFVLGAVQVSIPDPSAPILLRFCLCAAKFSGLINP